MLSYIWQTNFAHLITQYFCAVNQGTWCADLALRHLSAFCSQVSLAVSSCCSSDMARSHEGWEPTATPVCIRRRTTFTSIDDNVPGFRLLRTSSNHLLCWIACQQTSSNVLHVNSPSHAPLLTKLEIWAQQFFRNYFGLFKSKHLVAVILGIL